MSFGISDIYEWRAICERSVLYHCALVCGPIWMCFFTPAHVLPSPYHGQMSVVRFDDKVAFSL